jgi:putative transposase
MPWPPGQKYPQAVKGWENAWDRFTPFLAFTPPVRKLLYTTNDRVPELPAAESHKACGHFPTEQAALKCCTWRS